MVAFVSHLFWCWQGLDKVCSLEQLGCSYTHIRVLSFRISCSLAQKLFTNSAFWTSFPYTVPTLICHVYFHSANSTQWIAGMGWTQQPIQATSCNYAVCQDGHPNTMQSCPQAHRKGSMNLLLGFITMWHCRLFEATSGIQTQKWKEIPTQYINHLRLRMQGSIDRLSCFCHCNSFSYSPTDAGK